MGKRIEPLSLPASKTAKPKPEPQTAIAIPQAVKNVLDSPQHEAFAQMLAAGHSQADAYAQIYGGEPVAVRQNASRLAQKETVKNRVQQIQAATATGRYLTMKKKREFLHDVVFTPIDEVDRGSIFCQAWSESTSQSGGSESLKMPDKLRAIELDAKLAGELVTADSSKDGATFPITAKEINLIAMIVNGSPVGTMPPFVTAREV